MSRMICGSSDAAQKLGCYMFQPSPPLGGMQSYPHHNNPVVASRNATWTSYSSIVVGRRLVIWQPIREKTNAPSTSRASEVELHELHMVWVGSIAMCSNAIAPKQRVAISSESSFSS